ncbi:MAG: hypothetical protein AAFU78_22075, partial [Cyanobacteria bacterium J06633_2]
MSDETIVSDLLYKTLSRAEPLHNDEFKAILLTRIAESASQLADETDRQTLLEQTVAIANSMPADTNKSNALRGIARAYEADSNEVKALELIIKSVSLPNTTENNHEKYLALLDVLDFSSEISKNDFTKVLMDPL